MAHARWTLVAITASFVFFAVPVLRSRDVRDPLDHYFTDHIRYRYCAAEVLREPIRALTTPLHVLNDEGRAPHAATAWPDQPCHQAGLLHVAVHAPFQWLVERGSSEVRATQLYSLLLLVCAHACLFVLAVHGSWWVPLVMAPFVVHCALNDVQEPIAMLAGLIAMVALRSRTQLVAVLFVAIAGSLYNRWLVLVPPMAWICWRLRDTLVAEARSRPIVAASSVLLISSAVLPSLLVLEHLPPGAGRSASTATILALYGLGCVVVLARDRSELALFALAWTLHVLLHRQQMEYWYFGPLLILVPLARTRGELALWTTGLCMATASYVQGTHAIVADVLTFAAHGWRGAP